MKNTIKSIFRNTLNTIQLFIKQKVILLPHSDVLQIFFFATFTIIFISLFLQFGFSIKWVYYISFFTSCFILSYFLLNKSNYSVIMNFLFVLGFCVICLFFYLLFGITNIFEVIFADGIDDVTDKVLDSDNNSNNTNNNTNNINNDNNNSTNNNTNNKDKNKESYSYSGSVDKELADKVISKGIEVVKEGISTVAPNIGAYGAGAAVFGTMVKSTAGMPPLRRAVSVGAGTVLGTAAVRLGVKVGDSIDKNAELYSKSNSSVNTTTRVSPDQVNSGSGGNIESSVSIPSTPSSPPSTPVDSSFINSPLETTSPLEDLLSYQFTINIFIFILIISFLFLIFDLFIFKKNKEFISSIVEKYLPKKVNAIYIRILNKSSKFSDRFLLSIFILNTIILVYLVLLNIVISHELLYHTNEYIEVYNYIQNNSSSSSILILLYFRNLRMLTRSNINKRYSNIRSIGFGRKKKKYFIK